MKVKTKIKDESTERNHNETLVRVQKPTQGLKVKTNIKAGFTALGIPDDVGLLGVR